MRPEWIARSHFSAAFAAALRPAAEPEPERSPARRSFWNRQIAVLDRPLVDAEWDAVRAFVRRMARDDLRLRFGGALDLQDGLTLRRAFDIKHGVGEMAWTWDESGTLAGILHRIVASPGEAEIGLIVRSDLKRLGIGEFLLREMLARSAAQGVKTLSGCVLRENRAMLRLAAKVGGVPREISAWTMELTFDAQSWCRERGGTIEI
jgi:GNAT superfamily N-acetyltransferase